MNSKITVEIFLDILNITKFEILQYLFKIPYLKCEFPKIKYTIPRLILKIPYMYICQHFRICLKTKCPFSISVGYT